MINEKKKKSGWAEEPKYLKKEYSNKDDNDMLKNKEVDWVMQKIRKSENYEKTRKSDHLWEVSGSSKPPKGVPGDGAYSPTGGSHHRA